MRTNWTTGVIAAIAALGASAIFYLFVYEHPARIDAKTFESAGWGLAQATLALLKDGSSITVITRDTSVFKQPALDIQLASFKKAIGVERAKLIEICTIQEDPLRPVKVPPGDFFDLIRKARRGSVIVSFLGPPLLTEAQRAQLNEIKPKIVAVCSGSNSGPATLAALFEMHLLHAAIVSRQNPTPSTGASNNLRQRFEGHFLTVTASNASSLAAMEANPR